MDKPENKITDRLLRMSTDMIPVVFGVFLALALSNFQETQKEKVFVKKTIKAVFEENRLNRNEIDRVLEKQLKTVDSLVYYRDSSNVSILEIIRKVKGLSTPDIATTSSSFLLNSNITLVDFEMLKKLSQINSEIDNFEYQQRLMFNDFYDIIDDTSSTLKKRMTFQLNDIIAVEKNLIRLYEEFEQFDEKDN